MELRGDAALLTAEIVAVIACAVLPLPVPAQLPLGVVAVVSYALRRERWENRFGFDGFRLGLGIGTGACALVLALVAISPLLTARGAMVAWAEHAMVRGKPDAVVMVVIVVAATAVATELVFRGFILERVRPLVGGRGATAVALAISACVEATVMGGGSARVFGAALVSVALGGLYLATGRSLVAPIAARVTFDVGVVVLEGLKMIG